MDNDIPAVRNLRMEVVIDPVVSFDHASCYSADLSLARIIRRPSVRHFIEVVMIPWLVVTTLLLILLIYLWCA